MLVRLQRYRPGGICRWQPIVVPMPRVAQVLAPRIPAAGPPHLELTMSSEQTGLDLARFTLNTPESIIQPLSEMLDVLESP
jgi:hypothetical protein